MKNVTIICIVLIVTSCAVAQKSILFLAGAGQEGGGPKVSDDIVIETLMLLGYDVEYYYLDDPSKMTDSLGMDKDLVIVSSTVNSAHVGNFYIDKAVPVLTWEMGMFGKLSIASGGSNMMISETFITIVDESHPALAGHTGEVEVLLDSPMELTVADYEDLAQGAQVLAEVIHDEGMPMVALFVVEEGGTLLDSTAAPARRLSYFFRDETAIDATDTALALLGLCAKWTMGDMESSVEDLQREMQFHLLKNYPNPFNPFTTICFSLAKSENVTLTVYNNRGQTVKTLYSGLMRAGSHSISWHGLDDLRNPVPSGVYFYELVSENRILRNRMVLAK